MKKILSLLSVCLVAFFSSCGYEIPEKITLESDASYNFTVGEYSKSLAEYISVQKIKEFMTTSDDSKLSYSVYDYNPEGKSKLQQFLVEMAISEIPIDVGEYLEKLDFSDSTSSISGSNEISLGQKIEIPNLSERKETSKIDFPDISKKFTSSTIKIKDNLPIPEKSISESDGTLSALPVTVTSPTFKTAQFYSGAIVLNVKRTSGTVTSGFTSNFTFELLGENKEILSKVENIDIFSGSVSIEFPMAEKTITSSLYLKIYGNASGGKETNISYYSVTATFAEGTKFSKITGFTDSSASSTDVERYVQFTTDETFVGCEISEGSLEVYSKKPDGWTGIVAKTSDSATISGALTLADGEKLVSIGATDCFLDKKLNLAGSVYKKTTDDGKITFKDKLSFECNDATLVFPSGEQPELTLEIVCKISKASKVTLDLSSKKDMLSYSKSPTFPEDLTQNVCKLNLIKSGIELTYKNTLPKGADGENTIGLDVKSEKLGISDNTQAMLPENSDVLSYTSSETEAVSILPATDQLDFSISLLLPHDEGDPENYAVLKNVSLNGSYEISVTAKPVFDWESVSIKAENVTKSGSENTGLSFENIFSSLKEELGEDSAFIDNIYFTELPIYIYCTKPALESLDSFKFSGSVKFNNSSGTNPVDVIEKTDSINTLSEENLKKDENGTVITELSRDKASGCADIAPLFNSGRKDEIQIEYDISLAGADGEFTIEKADFEKLKEENDDTPLSMKFSARMVIPLELELKASEGENKVTNVNILKLAKVDTESDLFGRSEATSIDDIEKYLDLIESTSLYYTIKNELFAYESDVIAGKILFNTNMAELENPNYTINLKKGEVKILTSDVKKMLQSYPFKPDIEVQLPDGVLGIPRNAEFSINLALGLKTDGKIVIFGD